MSAAEVYRRTRKVPDLFFNSYLFRPIAAVLVAALRGSRVTPNQITLAAVLVALAAILVLVTVPTYAGLVLGVLVFEISYVLDCADGMLARWRGTASPVGHLLDFLMDEIKAFALLAGVSVRLFAVHGDARFLELGLLGLVALASGIGMTTFLRRPEVRGPEPAPATGGRRSPVQVVEGAAKFLIHYPSYIWFVALLGRIEWYFFPYIVVNTLYAARTLLQIALRFGRFEPRRPTEPTR
jgi:phosphatidylglycerophosphate synthase